MWHWEDQKISLAFYNGGLWENRFWGIKNNEDICPQNKIAEKYFIMDRSNLHFSFYSIAGNGTDIHTFPNRK